MLIVSMIGVLIMYDVLQNQVTMKVIVITIILIVIIMGDDDDDENNLSEGTAAGCTSSSVASLGFAGTLWSAWQR